MDIVNAEQTDDGIVITPANDTKEARAAWGTTRALINNMVTGVKTASRRSSRSRASATAPRCRARTSSSRLASATKSSTRPRQGITHRRADRRPKSTITGIDKQQVGQVAANIRAYRKPEPYKGKGVRYVGEYIARKEGKKK